MSERAFDIRKIVEEDGPVNELIQAAYLTIERNVAVYGEEPFGVLYTERWETLIPRLQRRMQKLSAGSNKGIVSDDAVNLLGTLGGYPHLTFVAFHDNPLYPQVEKPAAAIVSLWRGYGILLPGREDCDEVDAAVRASLHRLIRVAGDKTYRGLFEPQAAAYSARVRAAVRSAMGSAILYDGVNYKCCQPPQTGMVNYFCTGTMQPKSCYSPCSPSGCGTGSLPCNRPHRRPRK